MNLPVLQNSTLAQYQSQVARFPLIDEAQEQALARRWVEEEDVEAARQLVLANLRFVIKVAYEYVQYGFPMVDLIQEGNVGLMKAVRKFDPERGIRLISYAVFWIRAQIHEYIQKSWSMVRVATTRTQRKLFNMLQSTRSKLRNALARGEDPAYAEASDEAITRVASELDVAPDQIKEMQRRTTVRDVSIDQPIGVRSGSGDIDGALLSDTLASTWEDPETLVEAEDTRERFADALEMIAPSLNEREQFILSHRLLSDSPALLDEIGKRFGFSKERARQIEASLLKKLRTRLGGLGIAAA
jgi:RNA polymerase sigma-32 factor